MCFESTQAFIDMIIQGATKKINALQGEAKKLSNTSKTIANSTFVYRTNLRLSNRDTETNY